VLAPSNRDRIAASPDSACNGVASRLAELRRGVLVPSNRDRIAASPDSAWRDARRLQAGRLRSWGNVTAA